MIGIAVALSITVSIDDRIKHMPIIEATGTGKSKLIANIQMHLERNKTDKKDAHWICRYASEQHHPYWQMPDSAYFESKQLYNTIREYTEQIKRFNNHLHSLRLLPIPGKDTIRSLERMITHMEKEIKQLEQKLHLILEQWHLEQLKNASSIKGIGKRAAAMLIVFTQGFRYTQNHRQLISFAGLAPTQYSSGSSIHGKARIYKRGWQKLAGCTIHV